MIIMDQQIATEDQNQGEKRHTIFVDGTGVDAQQSYEDDVVEAATIIVNAGYGEEPEQYILEALRGQSGDVVEEFDPQGEVGASSVDLTEKHREHFRVTTRGEVFI